MAQTQAENRSGTATAIACLAIIGRQLGIEVTADQLVRDAGLKPGPVSTAQLIDCARRSGLQSKQLHLRFEELTGTEPLLPAIVRFKDGSCMVLLSVQRDSDIPSVLLQDPNAEADTPLVLDRMRFEDAWTGDIFLIRRRGDSGPVKRFGWPLVRQLVAREGTLVRDLAISTIVLSFVAITPMLFVQLMVQRVFVYGVTSTLVVLSVVFLVAIGVETVLGALRRFIVTQLTARTEAKLATSLLDRVLAMPLVTTQEMARGAITHRMEQLARLRAPVTADMVGAVLDLGLLVFFIPLMAFLSPVLTALFVVAAALVAWAVFRMLPKFRDAVSAADSAEERRAAFQSETVVGIKTVKALALDVTQRRHWRRLSDELAEHRLVLARLSSFVQALATPVESLIMAGTLAVGFYLSAIAGHFGAIGAMMAFYLLVQRLTAPLPGLARLAQHYESVHRTFTTLAGLVSRPAETGQPVAGSTAPIRGHVAFRNVSFRYKGTARPALSGVSFDCPPGMLLGITGHSGSGKSTIVRLLQRLYGEHRGTITIDGVDIRDYDPAHLRRTVAIVGQESFVFAGTIRENITAARIGAGFEEMTAAARLAGADEFIDKLPRGYETVVQEGAPNLSSGQRQRLALARALIANPRILVLDEALSALDGEIEMRVLGHLRAMAGERTVIVVSHRLSTLMVADAMMVMEDGTVHDFGRHRELLERSTLYSHQWHRERIPSDDDPQTDRLLQLS